MDTDLVFIITIADNFIALLSHKFQTTINFMSYQTPYPAPVETQLY